MFWRKKSDEGQRPSHQEQGNLIAGRLLAAAKIDFDQASQLQQALVGTFLFGMLTAEGMAQRLSPGDIRVIALKVFEDSLHYTPQAASDGVQQCIDATGPNGHDTMKAIIHRGIDGHRQLAAGDLEGLSANVGSVLGQFGVAP